MKDVKCIKKYFFFLENVFKLKVLFAYLKIYVYVQGLQRY